MVVQIELHTLLLIGHASGLANSILWISEFPTLLVDTTKLDLWVDFITVYFKKKKKKK